MSMNLTPTPLLPRFYDVNKVPLVAIDCASLQLRRYVGRECTNEATLEGADHCSPQEVRAMIELFRGDPMRALRAHAPWPPTDRVLA